MKKSVRTTISIPADLKARMNAMGDDVNWSAVACQAFEAKLNGETVVEVPSRKTRLRITVDFVDVEPSIGASDA